jgi:O-antigen/teichoic acid export membrane protein
MNKTVLQYFYYVLGEGISKGIIFLTLSFYTGYFSKTEFGKLSLFWISVPLFAIFIDFAQRSYIKKKYLHSPTKAVEAIFRIIMVSGLITLFYLLFIFVLGGLGVHIIDKKFDYLIILCALFYSTIELVLSYYQIGGNVKGYNFYYALRNALPYLLTIVFILFVENQQYNATIFAKIQLIILILISLAALLKIILNYRISLKSLMKKILGRIWISMKFSVPIMPGILSALLLSFADRFIINFFYSEVEVAEYTVAYTVSSIFMAFFLATNKMWQKFILENLKAKNIRKISVGSRKYIAVVIAVALGVILVRRPLVDIMANSSYYPILDIIPTIIAGMFFYFLYTILSNVPFYNGNTFLMAVPAIIAAVLNILLNFALIPVYGYKVAALTTLISYMVEFVTIYLICVKKYKTDILFYGFINRSI